MQRLFGDMYRTFSINVSLLKAVIPALFQASWKNCVTYYHIFKGCLSFYFQLGYSLLLYLWKKTCFCCYSLCTVVIACLQMKIVQGLILLQPVTGGCGVSKNMEASESSTGPIRRKEWDACHHWKTMSRGLILLCDLLLMAIWSAALPSLLLPAYTRKGLGVYLLLWSLTGLPLNPL